ncbi:MAG: hypothetical protein V3V55_09350, partial [Rhodospirillales bacterium]
MRAETNLLVSMLQTRKAFLPSPDNTFRQYLLPLAKFFQLRAANITMEPWAGLTGLLISRFRTEVPADFFLGAVLANGADSPEKPFIPMPAG